VTRISTGRFASQATTRAAIIASRPEPVPMSSTSRRPRAAFAIARSKASLRAWSLSMAKCQAGIMRR